MKIAVCEDDILAARALSDRVSAYFGAKGYLCEISVYADMASFPVENGGFDLVLLDCVLPDGNGLELADRLQKLPDRPVVIFISAYEEYVYRSFRVGTFRYLTKPVEEEAMCEALESFLSFYEHNTVLEIPCESRTVYARLEDVIYLESAKKHSIVRTRVTEYLSETCFESLLSLADYVSRIDHPAFFRTHKSFLVNMRFIESIDHNVITLSNGEKVEISRRRAAGFNEAYHRFLRSQLI